MRILHLVGRSHHRGAELVALGVSESLAPLGHESRVLAIGPGHEGGREEGIPVLTGAVRQHPVALLQAAWRLRVDVGDDRPDVILAHGGSALQAAVVGGRSVPIVHQLIMGMPVDDRGAAWRRWWGWLLGRCAAVVSLTDALTAEVVQLGYSGPVRLIPNARSSARFAAIDRVGAAARLRSELGVPTGRRLVGFVGHLVEQKRPDVAIDVAVRLRDAGHDVHLVVVGGGPLAERLREQVGRAGIADRVTFAGHRADVEEVLGGIDVLVLTSDGEGMPGVAIEAQMTGCPVVAFPVGGVAEVVGHETTGLVLADHDPEAMAGAVGALLCAPERLAEMGAAARVRSDRFSMERAAEVYATVLEEAVAGGA